MKPQYYSEDPAERNSRINELIYLSAQKDADAFDRLHRILVPVLKFVYANKNLNPVMSYADWYGESMIALEHALMRYRFDQDATFRTMYRSVLDNRAQDILRKTSSEKFKAVYYAVPLEFTANEYTGSYTAEFDSALVHSSEKERSLRQVYDHVIERLDKILSEQEMYILYLLQEGYTPVEISRRQKISRAKVYKILEKSRSAVSDLTPYIADAIV